MLKNVYSMNNVTTDQLKLLNAVRTSLNISEDMHNKLESEVKNELHIPMDKQPEVASGNTSVMPDRDLNILIDDPATESVSEPAPPPGESPAIKKVRIKKYLTLGKEKFRKNEFAAALELFIQGQMEAPENEEFEFMIKKVKLKLKEETPEELPEKEEISSELSEPSTRVAIPIESSTNGSSTPTSTNPQTETQPQHAPTAIPVEAGSTTPASAATEVKPDDGSKADDDSSKCISCEATGKCYWCGGSGKCDRCDGSGTYNGESCAMCTGSGKCNSCEGEGTCMWCHGSGTGSGPTRNKIYAP